MLKLFDMKKRWGILQHPKYKAMQLHVGRSKADGSTVSIRMPTGNRWMTVDTEELLILLMHVTNTEEQLREKLNDQQA